MRSIREIIAAALFCAALWLATGAAASGPPALQRWVVAGGGGQVANRTLLLRATAGQGMTGLSSTRTAALCAGFWCAGLPESRVYLPLVLR